MTKYVPFQMLKLYSLNQGDTLTMSTRDKSKETIAFEKIADTWGQENYSFKNLTLSPLQVEQMIFDYFVEHE